MTKQLHAKVHEPVIGIRPVPQGMYNLYCVTPKSTSLVCTGKFRYHKCMCCIFGWPWYYLFVKSIIDQIICKRYSDVLMN